MKPEIKTCLAQIRAGEIPQGYKNTPIGILKSDWSYAKLNEIVDILTETAGKKQYETLSISAGMGFVNQAKKFGKELSGKQYEKYIVLRKGDFSYNKGNSKAYPQGCIYRLNDRAEAAVPNVFESFRIANGYPEYYEQLFIAGFLNSQLYRFINHGIRDDGLLNLTEKDFYSCIVPVPPLEEQQRIASILSAQDKVIELCERKLEQLKRMKKYYLQNMFPKDGEEYPEIRFKGFTDAWEQRKVSSLITDIADGPFGSNLKTEHYTDEKEARIIQLSNLSDNGWQEENTRYTTFEHANEIKRCIVNEGELVMGKMMPAGMTIIRPNTEKMYVLSSDCVRIKLDNNIAINKFFLYTTKSDTFLNQVNNDSQGSTRIRTSISKIRDMDISLPSVPEQEKIGEYFTNLDTLITLHQRKCEEEKKKKKALQQLLLTGISRINYE